jgi:hypothetical protein
VVLIAHNERGRLRSAARHAGELLEQLLTCGGKVESAPVLRMTGRAMKAALAKADEIEGLPDDLREIVDQERKKPAQGGTFAFEP